MNDDNIAKRSQLIAERTGLKEKYVRGVVDLLQEGATVPFISRYRKEATGGMTDVEVAQVAAELDKVTELEHRKEFILTTIEGQGKLTPELRTRIEGCWDATTLEDIALQTEAPHPCPSGSRSRPGTSGRCHHEADEHPPEGVNPKSQNPRFKIE